MKEISMASITANTIQTVLYDCLRNFHQALFAYAKHKCMLCSRHTLRNNYCAYYNSSERNRCLESGIFSKEIRTHTVCIVNINFYTLQKNYNLKHFYRVRNYLFNAGLILYSKFAIECTEKPIWNLFHIAYVIKFLALSCDRWIKIGSTADTGFDKRMVDLCRTLVVHWSKHWQTQLPQLWTEYKKPLVMHVWFHRSRFFSLTKVFYRRCFELNIYLFLSLLYRHLYCCFYRYFIAYSTEKFFYDHSKIYNLKILKIILKIKYICMLLVIMHTADACYLKIKKIRL